MNIKKRVQVSPYSILVTFEIDTINTVKENINKLFEVAQSVQLMHEGKATICHFGNVGSLILEEVNPAEHIDTTIIINDLHKPEGNLN